MKAKLCKCGCGQPVTKESNIYIRGHHMRKSWWEVEKLCECGCGQPAPRYRSGRPRRFVAGHSSRGKNNPRYAGGQMFKKNNGRWYVYDGNLKMKLRARDVMEKHLGRPLLPGEEVHHINGNRADDRIENLLLTKSRADHFKHHRKFTQEGLVEILKSVAQKINRAPKGNEIDALSPSAKHNTFCRYFGSWSAALIAAGLTPNHPGPQRRN